MKRALVLAGLAGAIACGSSAGDMMGEAFDDMMDVPDAGAQSCDVATECVTEVVEELCTTCEVCEVCETCQECPECIQDFAQTDVDAAYDAGVQAESQANAALWTSFIECVRGTPYPINEVWRISLDDCFCAAGAEAAGLPYSEYCSRVGQYAFEREE